MSRKTKDLLVGVPVGLFILFLAAVAIIPNFIPERTVVARNACAYNLRWLYDAKSQWAVAGHKSTNEIPTERDLAPFLRESFPSCPSGGTYTIGPVGQPPRCSVGGVGHTLPKD